MATGEFGKFVNKVKQSAISVAGELTPVLKVSNYVPDLYTCNYRILNFARLV